MQLYKSGLGVLEGGRFVGVGGGWRHTNNCVLCVRLVCHLFVSTRWRQLERRTVCIEKRSDRRRGWLSPSGCFLMCFPEQRHTTVKAMQASWNFTVLSVYVCVFMCKCVCVLLFYLAVGKQNVANFFFPLSSRPLVRLNCRSLIQVVSCCFFSVVLQATGRPRWRFEPATVVEKKGWTLSGIFGSLVSES